MKWSVDAKEKQKIFWSLVASALIVSVLYFAEREKVESWIESQFRSPKPAATASQQQAPSAEAPATKWGEPILMDEVTGRAAVMPIVRAFVEDGEGGIPKGFAWRFDLVEGDGGYWKPRPESGIEVNADDPERLYRMIRSSRSALWIFEKHYVTFNADYSESHETKHRLQVWCFGGGSMKAEWQRRDQIKSEDQ